MQKRVSKSASQQDGKLEDENYHGEHTNVVVHARDGAMSFAVTHEGEDLLGALFEEPGTSSWGSMMEYKQITIQQP